MTRSFIRENEQLLIDLYVKDLKSATEIAEMFGKKNEYHKILRILKRHKIPVRAFGDTRPRGITQLDVNYFKEIDSSEKAYWLGFLYADGSITYHNGHPSKITLALKDEEPIINFKKAINSNHKLGKYEFFDKRTNKSYHNHAIQIASKHFAQHIFNLGLQGKGNCADFPRINEEYYFDFLRGLFDGDGSLIHGKRVQLLGTDKIIEFIQNFLVTKFNFSKTKIYYTYKLKNGYLCVLLINKLKDVYSFLKKIHKNSTPETRLNRKYLPAQYFIQEYEQRESKKIEYCFIKDSTVIKSKTLHELAKIHGLTTQYLKDVWLGKRSHHKGWTAYRPKDLL